MMIIVSRRYFEILDSRDERGGIWEIRVCVYIYFLKFETTNKGWTRKKMNRRWNLKEKEMEEKEEEEEKTNPN